MYSYFYRIYAKHPVHCKRFAAIDGQGGITKNLFYAVFFSDKTVAQEKTDELNRLNGEDGWIFECREVKDRS